MFDLNSSQLISLEVDTDNDFPGLRVICAPSPATVQRLVTAPVTLETAQWSLVTDEAILHTDGCLCMATAQQNNRQTLAPLPCQDL